MVLLSSSPSSTLKREASTPSCSSSLGVTLLFKYSVQAKLTRSALKQLISIFFSLYLKGFSLDLEVLTSSL